MTEKRIEPPSISDTEVDAFLDSLDFMTIQRAWDRKSAQLHVVLMPLADDDE